MWYPIGATAPMPNPSAAVVKVNEDGTAIVLLGTVEVGQGVKTVLGQIAAEGLGLTADEVTVITADTDTTPFDTGPVASRTTYVTGNALNLAVAEAKRMLIESAAMQLGVQPGQLELKDRRIQVSDFPQKGLPVAEVARRSHSEQGRPIVASATYNPSRVPLDPESGQGKPFSAYAFATQMAEVEVDTETGQVDVLRVVAAHDCGTAINPMFVEGQIEGGIVMGLGYALSEEIVFAEGVQRNPNLTDYVVATSADVPTLYAEAVEKYDPTGPFGAKGVGEPTMVPTAPAVLNAIYDAVGVRLYSLPATPEKVLRALRELPTKGEG